MIKILITGDLCPINRIARLANIGDYKSIFNDFISVLAGSDLNITNLECPLYGGSNAIKKSGPSLKGDESFSKVLKFGNIHLATLANNHLMDYGPEGLKRTVEACKQENVSTVGAGFNFEEARRPFYITIKSKTIAILNFAENEFSTTQNDNPGANPLSIISNFTDIKMARENADFVFVIVHGGHENYQLPSPRMQETYRFFIDAGADAIIGHHTHCYSGYEIYKKKMIFYSLGNFIFDWPNVRNSNWNKGYAIQFVIDKDLIDFNIYPYVQGDQEPGVRLMREDEKQLFDDQLSQLNRQIIDPQILNAKFQEFLQASKKNYLLYIEPYSNQILMELRNRGLLPSFVSEKKKKLLLNLVRCESHRDLFIKSLSD